MSLGGTERLQNSIHQLGAGRVQTHRSLVIHVKSHIKISKLDMSHENMSMAKS